LFCASFLFLIWYGGGEARSEFLLKGETGGILRASSVALGFAKTIVWGKDFAKPHSLIFGGISAELAKRKRGLGKMNFCQFCFGLGVPIS
jgi:hypothetical protein